MLPCRLQACRPVDSRQREQTYLGIVRNLVPTQGLGRDLVKILYNYLKDKDAFGIVALVERTSPTNCRGPAQKPMPEADRIEMITTYNMNHSPRGRYS